MTNHFEQIVSFDVEYAPAHITQWRSSRTGLQVVSIYQETPMINGNFAVVTEVENDSGTPHTLEHLIFMGSRKYPYKGLLDVLSGQHFGETNAWTATDKTVYTLKTAGWEAFNKLLPVYLDHIINPTLTDEGCVTEVYHIDENGKDKGVVYSEMEGRVNDAYSISDLECRKTIYSESSGYSSETGGLLESLRVLSNQQIKDFHKLMYRPDNLCVIVNGPINETELMETLVQFDSTLVELPKIPKPRPFIDSPDPVILKEDIVKEVYFPDSDESSGSITFGLVGPDFTNYIDSMALDLIFKHLTEDEASFLYANLVEIDDPWCSDISAYQSEYQKALMNFYAEGVDSEKLKDCEKLVRKLLKDFIDDGNFDLEKLKITIQSTKDEFISTCESSPDKLTDIVIDGFVYSNRQAEDLLYIKDLNDFDQILSWDEKKWIEFYKKYIIDNPIASIVTYPSRDLNESNQKKVENLVNDRKSQLGESGLKKLKEKLEKAIAKNNTPIPNEIFDQFIPSDVNNIKYIDTFPIVTTKPKLNENLQFHKDVFNDLPKDLPFEFYLNQYKSNFINVYITFSGDKIPVKSSPYIMLFQELTAMPMILDNGDKLSYEAVVEGLKKDFISCSVSSETFGSPLGRFSELLTFKGKLKKENYTKCIDWIKKLFFNTVFDQSRMKACIDKFLNFLPEVKRDGHTMLSYLSNQQILTKKSLTRSLNYLDLEPFYHELSELIKTENGFKEIVENLEIIRKSLFFSPDNYKFATFGGLPSKNPITIWNPFIEKLKTLNLTTPLKLYSSYKIPTSLDYLSEIGKNCGRKAFLMGTPGSESNYLYSIANLSIDYYHKDFPALTLANNYFQVVEGPLWKSVRGAGLAYGVYISIDCFSNEIYFSAFKATDVIETLMATKKVIENFANGIENFEKNLIESAISYKALLNAENESNLRLAAIKNYSNCELAGLSKDYKEKLLDDLKKVSIDDLVRVTKKYFLPIFETKSSNIFAVFHPKNEVYVTESLKKIGYNVKYDLLTGVDDSDDDSEGSDENEDDEDDE